MKKACLVLIALSALASVAASAADMPTKAPVYKAPAKAAFSWTGIYFGGNGGGGLGSTCWHFVESALDAGCHDMSGGVAGGQIGFNWQANNLVLGAEFSGDWADLKGSNTPVGRDFTSDHTQVSGLLMATARAGYAWDRSLLYVRGGAAWARDEYSVTCNGVTLQGTCLPVGFTSHDVTDTRVGGVVGGGLEYAVTNNLSLAAEGDYLPLGTKSIMLNAQPGFNCGGGKGQPCTISVDQNLWIVTGRINFRFGAP